MNACSCGEPVYAKGECRRCYNRRYFEANRERYRDYKRRRREDPVLAEHDREISQAWKERNREANRARDREYRRSRQKVCECGRLCEESSRRCIECIRAAAEERRERIAALYRDGAPLREIADRLGISVTNVSVNLDWLRKRGRVGRRYAGGA